MQSRRVELVEGGHLVIPEAFRRALGIATGDILIVEITAGELRIRPAVDPALAVAAAVRDVQERLRGLNPEARLLSQELIADRREEAENE